MNKQFDILSNFKGFGNPNANFWFVGIEEAIDFEKNIDSIIRTYSSEVLTAKQNEIKEDAKKYGRTYTKIYDIMSKVIVGIADDNDWKKYRNEMLLQSESNEFQMNLYPLGNKNVKEWNIFYQNEFKFKDKKDYLNYVAKYRFPLLEKFRKLKNPQLTICFGKTYKEEFKNAFNLKREIYYKEFDLIFFPDDKAIISPFFDNRNMCQKRINKVVEIAKSFINN